MYLSGTIDKIDGTLKASASITTNGGTYYDSYTADGQYKTWYETVYNDENIVDRQYPSHIVVNTTFTNKATIIVEECEVGSDLSNDPILSGSVDIKAGGATVLQQPVDAHYFRVRTINGAASPGTLKQTVRMKDVYH